MADNAGPELVGSDPTNAQDMTGAIDKVLTGPLKFPLTLENEGAHFAVFSNYEFSRATLYTDSVKIPRGQLFLPMPANLGTKYNESYENTQMGIGWNIAQLIVNRVPGAAQSVTAAKTKEMLGNLSVGSAMKTGGDIIKSGIDLVTHGLKDLPGEVLSAGAAFAMEHSNVAALTGHFLGVARNPHLALLFNGPNFRQHAFEYNFVARNQKESDALRQVIQRFKIAMSPRYFTSDRNIFSYPDAWDIKFYYAGKDNTKNLFAISQSVLDDFAINYHSQGMPLYFEDTGAPVNVTISMSFTELTIITRDDIIKENR